MSELQKANNEKHKSVLEMQGHVERSQIQINNLNEKVGDLEVQLMQARKIKGKDQLKMENTKLL